ncbi:DUF397 domain-containing protein [Streptomyces sp. NBC_00631]|uniref:DUF397 domain-containing protein n=1 Tax=Streptomyces sp. NBC_00631 TaxID=2975793 RepID=UPI0030E5318D
MTRMNAQEPGPLGFRRSSFCQSNGSGCVEIDRQAQGAVVRSSKNPDGPALHFTEEEWRTFIQGVQAGEFD